MLLNHDVHEVMDEERKEKMMLYAALVGAGIVIGLLAAQIFSLT